MRISNALATWARGLHEHPRLGMLGVLLVSLGAAFGITRFEIDPDVSALLPNDSEEVALFKATNLGESSSRTLYLLVEGDELSTRLGPFVERLQASPFLTRITATRAEFGGEFARQAAQAPLWYLSETSLDELESRLQAPGRRLAIKESKDLLISDPLMGREVVKSDPLGLRWVLSQAADVALPSAFEATSPYLLLANGTQAFIRIEGRKSSYDVDFSERLLADIEARGEGLELLEVGGYAIAREDSRRIRGDLTSSLQWSIPLLLLFFLFSTRSLVLPQLYLLPTALAVFWTLGYGGLILGPMTPLAVSAAAILCGLGVDFSIHYLGRYREESESLEPLEALEATQRATGRSLIGCWLTSSVAFLSLAFGAFDGLRSLGMLLALGLTLTLLSTWTVLPLLLHRVPVFPKSGTPGPVPRLFARMAHSPLATVISVLIILAAGSGWLNSVRRGVPVDADPSLLRPADSTLARAVVKLEQALGFAPEGVTLLLDHATSAARLVDAGRALQDSEKVAFTDADQLTVLSTERVERVQAFRENTNEWVQGAMEDLQAAGLRPESLRAGLEEFALAFDTDPKPNTPTAKLVRWNEKSFWRATFHPPTSLKTREDRDQFRADLQAAVNAPTRAMDPGALGDAIGPLLAQELQRALTVCGLIVFLIILASVGRLRPGLIAMTPVFCGLGVVLGSLSVFGWVIHPGNLLALPLLIGLGVDDGLYMVNRSLEEGSDPLQTTGVDVWRTTVTTAVGFGSLMTAATPAIASLGALVLIGTLTCYITSVVLVPRLLRGSRSATAPLA